jgi:hypothetical protein
MMHTIAMIIISCAWIVLLLPVAFGSCAVANYPPTFNSANSKQTEGIINVC